MARTKVLITVKTYPTLSEKYDELVCTAGFLEDGSWVRIFPVPFRKLDYQNRYTKWQWIELDLVKNTSDFRPESFRPSNIENEITILDQIDTRGNWAKRKAIVGKHIWYNMSDLLKARETDNISLGILKPQQVLDFVWEACEREWDKKKMDTVIANQAQGSLFSEEDTRMVFKAVKKLPYNFSYVFTTQDGVKRKLMIEDWELGMLYWNCLDKAKGDEDEACKKVKEMYFEHMVNKCDLHFFLGTTKQFHNIAPNPFIIIGAFYPPKTDTQQLNLF